MYQRWRPRANPACLPSQAYIQCNEDSVDRDIQTEEVETREVWTQHPGKAPLCLGVTASALGLGGCVHPLSCSFLGLICACVCADCGNSSEFVDTTAAWRPGLGPD